jgi:hypothetical protein
MRPRPIIPIRIFPGSRSIPECFVEQFFKVAQTGALEVDPQDALAPAGEHVEIASRLGELDRAEAGFTS